MRKREKQFKNKQFDIDFFPQESIFNMVFLKKIRNFLYRSPNKLLRDFCPFGPIINKVIQHQHILFISPWLSVN
ncbi:unnamed protein product [Paramecium sonneborni]|uniref:Uncharacterized protein n=1 Tax=Paramecium sonneborni TaxID=65129 RepID=A0A8S1MPC8_9CILI|nr:unnamed protein product [Paramecium sonneborni]